MHRAVRPKPVAAILAISRESEPLASVRSSTNPVAGFAFSQKKSEWARSISSRRASSSAEIVGGRTAVYDSRNALPKSLRGALRVESPTTTPVRKKSWSISRRENLRMGESLRPFDFREKLPPSNGTPRLILSLVWFRSFVLQVWKTSDLGQRGCLPKQTRQARSIACWGGQKYITGRSGSQKRKFR